MVTCPTCRIRTAWNGNVHRPFCSLTCRLIDLGVWLDERYRIPAEPEPTICRWRWLTTMARRTAPRARNVS